MFACRRFQVGEQIRRVDDSETADEALIASVSGGETLVRLDYYPDRVVALPFPDGFFNHSCDPNAFSRWDEDGRFVVARRSIAAGEEITEDYCINSRGDTVWSCHCGARRCRRAVHSDFFRLPHQLQEEYRPLLAPWFVAANPGLLAQ